MLNENVILVHFNKCIMCTIVSPLTCNTRKKVFKCLLPLCFEHCQYNIHWFYYHSPNFTFCIHVKSPVLNAETDLFFSSIFCPDLNTERLNEYSTATYDNSVVWQMQHAWATLLISMHSLYCVCTVCSGKDTHGHVCLGRVKGGVLACTLYICTACTLERVYTVMSIYCNHGVYSLSGWCLDTPVYHYVNECFQLLQPPISNIDCAARPLVTHPSVCRQPVHCGWLRTEGGRENEPSQKRIAAVTTWKPAISSYKALYIECTNIMHWHSYVDVCCITDNPLQVD